MHAQNSFRKWNKGLRTGNEGHVGLQERLLTTGSDLDEQVAEPVVVVFHRQVVGC